MIKLKEELRIVGQVGEEFEVRLVNTREGLIGTTVPEIANEVNGTLNLHGINDIMQVFKRHTYNSFIRRCIVGGLFIATGVSLAFQGVRGIYSAPLAVIGSGILISGIVRKNSMQFRDCSGNVVDLLLGILYIRGFDGRRYVCFTHFADADRK